MNPRRFLAISIVGGALIAACATRPKPLEVMVQASEFRFAPASIEVQAGQQLTITMENMGTVEHDFVIMEIPMEEMAAEMEEEEGHSMEGMGMEMEPAVHMGAMAGMSGHVSFVPTQPGTYEFFCAVEGHKEAGMVGALIVR